MRTLSIWAFYSICVCVCVCVCVSGIKKQEVTGWDLKNKSQGLCDSRLWSWPPLLFALQSPACGHGLAITLASDGGIENSVFEVQGTRPKSCLLCMCGIWVNLTSLSKSFLILAQQALHKWCTLLLIVLVEFVILMEFGAGCLVIVFR